MINERYEQLADRFDEVETELAQPDTLQDQARWQALLRERAELEERVSAWREYRELARRLAEARELADDPEMGELAGAEAAELAGETAAMEQKLRILLLPKDPDDDKSVILEIRAGAGGEEAALFAADLARMYLHDADRCGFRAEAVSESPTELGGYRECVFMLTGRGAFSRYKFESGVHRVQRVPVTDTTGKKQTSTCTVAVLPEADEVDLVIDPKDLRIDTYRATGHGGQYINMTDSAVRITHLPTGITATCQDQKSQLKNREQAMKVLRSRLLEKAREEHDAAYASRRRSQVGTGDRSERIRTYNFHEGRVTDHRIGLTIYRIDDVMNGDLDEIIGALHLAEQTEMLRQIR